MTSALRRLLLAALLPACVTPTPEPPVLVACVAPEGGWEDSEVVWEEGLTAAFTGEVVDAGAGEDPGGCLEAGQAVGDPFTVEEVAWMQVRDGEGGLWWVMHALPGVEPLTVGAAAEVDFTFRFGGWGPDIGSFELRDGGRRLVAWLGEGGSVDDLAPPEGLEVRQGERAGGGRDGCGRWTLYDMVASLGADEVVLPYGEQATLRDLTLVHGGLARDHGTNTCMDWFVAEAALAVIGG